jgi:hypothetical protein
MFALALLSSHSPHPTFPSSLLPLASSSPLLQVSQYLPDYLPSDQVYQPEDPKPEDVAVLLEGDEEIDLDTLKQKGESEGRSGVMVGER